MSVAFWVYLSTIIFLAFVILKSYKLIVQYFDRQQSDIKSKLIEAEEIYQKAYNLYEEYRERMETLELEAEQILKDASFASQEIIDGAEYAVAKIITKKQIELSQRVRDYENQFKNQIFSKYADIITDNLYETAASGKYNINTIGSANSDSIKN